MDPVNRKLSDILERTVRVETKLDNLTDIQENVDDAKEIAKDAKSSAKTANIRLDKYDRVIFWVLTTVIGIILVAVINTIII